MAYVQGSSHQNGAASSSTVAVTLTGAVGNGNTLCVMVGFAGGAATTWTITVTDDKTNTFTSLDFAFDSTHTYSAATAYIPNVTNAPQTITATIKHSGVTTAVTFATIIVDEFSGVTASPLDGHIENFQGAPGTGTDLVTSSNITTTVGGDLIWGCTINSSGNANQNFGTGYTSAQNVSLVLSTEYKTQVAAGAVAATFTALNASDYFLTTVIALKQSVVVGAPKTLYVLGSTAVTPNFWGNMQDGGSAPTPANSAFGWLVAKIAIATSPFWRARLGATAVGSDAASATSFISGASGPTKGTGSGAATAGDAFVAGPYIGTFAAGAWTLTLMMRASVAGAVGHLNMRVWRSANADGTSATSLTASLVGTAVTLSTTADVNGMGTTTWSPAAITLSNEYLFFQFEWQETTTGTSNTDNVLFRVGTALVTTTNFVPTQFMYAKRRFNIWTH